MMMGNLSDEESNHHTSGDESVDSEDGEQYRLDLVTNQAKAKEEGRVN